MRDVRVVGGRSVPRKPSFDPPPESETMYPDVEDYAARVPSLMPLPMSPAEFRLACRRRMPTVLAVLDRILADPNSSITSLLAATTQITERAFGKSPVVEEVSQNRSARDMSTDELLAITRADLESRGVDVDVVLTRAREASGAH